MQETGQETQNKSTAPTRSRKVSWKRKRNPARLPWWRELPVGYLMTFPLVGLGLSVPFGFQYLGITNTFLGTPSVLMTLIIALIWGTEPAILSILISTLALDVYFLSPTGLLSVNSEALLQLVPFVLTQIIIVMVAARLARGRRQILLAQQKLEVNADDLLRVNDKLMQVNQELEKANVLKDHFLSMASHELKTPITTIRGHAQLGMRRLSSLPDLPPELESLNTAFDRIDQQTFRLNNLVDNLLDLSILRSGKMTLRLSDCDLREICSEVVSEQQSLSGRKIELEIPPSPVVLQADSERLSQVVTNLLTNALKYSPEESPVQVQVSQSKNKAIIRVHNDGQPIPKEQLASIFEPFYRAPAAQKSSKKGWGLGLAISQQIVDRHNGRIWVESSEGKGTTFSVELPMKQRIEQAQEMGRSYIPQDRSLAGELLAERRREGE
ncbi:MAG TPA: ATP-binding protein [Ktedonobacteraceae bacterium]|nr:ATP-binding protein [Ktedonobacteraceae bacterium]